MVKGVFYLSDDDFDKLVNLKELYSNDKERKLWDRKDYNSMDYDEFASVLLKSAINLNSARGLND